MIRPAWLTNQKLALYGAGFFGVLVLWGLATNWVGGVRREERARYERLLSEQVKRDTAVDAKSTAATQEKTTAGSAQNAQRKTQNDRRTVTQRETIRYYPVPTPAAPDRAPAPGHVSPAPSLQRDPAADAAGIAEVVRETIREEDRGTEEAISSLTTQLEHERQAKAEAEARLREREETERTEREKTETEKRTAAASDPEGGRFGVGVLSNAQPALTVDLGPGITLGPRALKLGQLKPGLLVTRGLSGGQIDGGPKVGYQKKRLEVFGGYLIREKAPVAGVAFKF